jgi:ribose transport system ATP-binding protein
MVPEDRKQHGVILSLSVKQNISITNLKNITGRLGFIQRRKESKITNELIKRLSVKTDNPDQPAESLSGGSQQKVSLAKWFNSGCRILIIDEPTRGIDVGAKVEIYKLINDLSHSGVAIIVISSETSELMGICDRIMVMRNGRIEGILERGEYSEEGILRLAIGANQG